MLECSIDQAEALVGAYRDERGGYHKETVIGAAGALLGHAIQASAYNMAANGIGTVSEFERMTNPPFGTYVNCADRIQIFVGDEFPFLLTVAEQLAWFPREAAPDLHEIVIRVIEQIGGDWFPRLSVPSQHQPREWSPDAVPRWRDEMRSHLDRHGLSQNLCEVICLMLAVGYLVSEAKDAIDPAVGLQLGFETAIATANIGNLNRPHVVTAAVDPIDDHLSDDFQFDIAAFAREAELDAAEAPHKSVLAAAAERVTSGNAETSPENEAIVMELGTSETIGDDLDDMPAPRLSRLRAERRTKPAFGKRQVG